MRRRHLPVGGRAWIGALACAALVTGCASAPPAHQGPPPFVRPHWDQVCFERDGPLPIRSVAEVAEHVTFEPALRNGEPMASSIVVSLIFPEESARFQGPWQGAGPDAGGDGGAAHPGCAVIGTRRLP